MQIGDAVGEGWEIYKRFWRHLLPIALVTYLVVSLISVVLTLILGILGVLASVVVAIVGIFLLQAALVEAVADVRDGRADLSLTQTLGNVWPRLPSVIVAGLLAGIAIAIGLLLLLVPGLYLMTIWSAVIPVVVLEKAGALDAFGRSRELVRGYGWTVFGVIVVSAAIQIAAGILIAIVFAALPDAAGNYIEDVVSNTIVAPLVAAIWTCMYFRLRELKSVAADATPVVAQ